MFRTRGEERRPRHTGLLGGFGELAVDRGPGGVEIAGYTEAVIIEDVCRDFVIIEDVCRSADAGSCFALGDEACTALLLR